MSTTGSGEGEISYQIVQIFSGVVAFGISVYQRRLPYSPGYNRTQIDSQVRQGRGKIM